MPYLPSRLIDYELRHTEKLDRGTLRGVNSERFAHYGIEALGHGTLSAKGPVYGCRFPSCFLHMLESISYRGVEKGALK